ncbi:MAG: PilZ domain-containing protein [Sphingomonadales bacterium]|nr:PilZ domain-containing protein [Sphingomonadales bacterium]MDE2171429.1 PilZ domain-containing protein [Sphingomonadales bacterium]
MMDDLGHTEFGAVGHEADGVDDSGLDRRRCPRKKSVLMIGRLTSNDEDHLCLVQDVSRHGAQIKLTSPVDIGQPVVLSLRDRSVLAGKVRWAHAPSAGIEFDEPAPHDPMLKPRLQPCMRRRFHRFARCAVVMVRYGAGSLLGDLVDMGQGGLCVQLDDRLPGDIGSRVHVTVRGFVQQTASIRWKKGNLTGLAFEAPLQFRQTEEWLDGGAAKCHFCTKGRCA